MVRVILVDEDLDEYQFEEGCVLTEVMIDLSNIRPFVLRILDKFLKQKKRGNNCLYSVAIHIQGLNMVKKELNTHRAGHQSPIHNFI